MDAPIALISDVLIIGGSLYLIHRARQAWQRELANDHRFAGDAQQARRILAACTPRACRFLGCLLAGASGDALGRMTESLPRWLTRWRYGEVRAYRKGILRPVRGLGHYTDDTQLTLAVARSIDDQGRFQPELLRRELAEWLRYRIGAGRATVEAAQRLRAGAVWEGAGDKSSAGNGSAMRVAPLGLVYGLDRERLPAAAALSSVGTHAHPAAVAAAQLVAAGVALALDADPASFSGAAFLTELKTWTDHAPWQARLDELPGLLARPTAEALAAIGTGGYVLQSVAAAFYLFAKEGANLEQAVVTAANAGGDTDSMASIVGNLCGALHGYQAIPEPWLRGLQHRDYIVIQAHRLYELSRRAAV